MIGVYNYMTKSNKHMHIKCECGLSRQDKQAKMSVMIHGNKALQSQGMAVKIC